MRTLLVTGGRHYDKWSVVATELDAYRQQWPELRVIQGGATGADELARCWASIRGVQYKTYKVTPEQWAAAPRRAGHERNQQMLDEETIDEVMAFPGGGGTADMCERAERAGIPVLRRG